MHIPYAYKKTWHFHHGILHYGKYIITPYMCAFLGKIETKFFPAIKKNTLQSFQSSLYQWVIGVPENS